MTVSFVIPAYNEEKRISQCLHSVMREREASGCRVEIVVVDNASTDRTAAIASALPGVRVVREPRKGLLFARQRGFQESKGELLACIDADTILTRGWIERAVRAFQRNPRLVCLSGPYVYHDLSSVTKLFVALWYLAALLLMGYLVQYVFRRSAMLQGGNYVVRRSALAEIGGYDTSIAFFGEDIDLACRLVRTGDVRFTFRLPIRTSGRRLKKEGVVLTAANYAANSFSVLARGRPSTHRYSDVRDA